MLKNLSKSVEIMFIFDLLIFICSTIYLYNFFNLNNSYLIITVCLYIITGLTVLFLKDNYKIREFNITFKNAYLLFEGVIFASIPAAIFLYILSPNINAIFFVISNLITVWLLLLLYRIIFHYYLFNFKRTKRVLIVGSGTKAEIIKDLINKKYALKMKVVSEYDDNAILINSNCSEETDFQKSDLMCKIYNEIVKIIENEKIDIVIYSSFGDLKKEFCIVNIFGLIYSRPKNVKFYSMHNFYEMALRKCYVDDYSALEIQNLFLHKRFNIYNFCKRIYDIIAALIILTVTFPILLYIGIRVKLIDGGSVIYTQNRVGRGGKTFKAYKIRTMYTNNYIPNQKNLTEANEQDNDARVIPFCKWVRKARFDEIPQMINILKGEMSIVGPRAEWEDVVRIYEKEVPYHSYRNLVKSGWTGWAQINQGHLFSSDLEAEKLQYDFYYIKHRNILWEIGILIKAVFLALGGRHG